MFVFLYEFAFISFPAHELFYVGHEVTLGYEFAAFFP